ncbi:Dimer Tnp hAT domain-containing protein [Aphis craccivora]|uniref:Dimer Tnp hAT domain-containing protein n=1 Tax=Aphis craccivora TaxID=307492 RepID=A0A6G0YBG0_APHCR|nr:Dimer Tnp hAT domain-containing protein [Aphis craccivora]
MVGLISPCKNFTVNQTRIICQFKDCQEVLLTLVKLGKYLNENHGIESELEKIKFNDETEFKQWNSGMEQKTLTMRKGTVQGSPALRGCHCIVCFFSLAHAPHRQNTFKQNPVLVEGNVFMFIKPRVKFLSITIDQEHFANSDQNDVTNDNKQFLPAENIFSNEENDFVTLRNTNDNSI